MKYLITYIIISYPAMGIWIWINFKSIKQSINKAMGGDLAVKIGLGVAKGISNNFKLKDKIKSPFVFLPLVLIVAVITPFLFTFYLYDGIKEFFKKIINKFRKKKEPELIYRAREVKFSEEQGSYWIIEKYTEGEWVNFNSLYTDELTIKIQVDAANELYLLEKNKDNELSV